MIGVRWREDTGFEGKCEYCREYWPLETEFWRVNNGLRRCAACYRIYFAALERGRRMKASEVEREARRQASAVRYQERKHSIRESQARWRAANRDRIAAYNREYRAKNREKLARASREYHRENAEIVSMKKRLAYAERKNETAA